MSSWNQVGPISTIRTGYYQDKPDGIFNHAETTCTVVSAYYQLDTKKHTFDAYKQYMKFFFQLNINLVFFCEESFVELSAHLSTWVAS